MRKRFLTVLTALCMVLTLLPGTVLAATVASGTCGANESNVTWTLDDAGTLTISGTGKMANYYSESTPGWKEYKSSIKTIHIQNGVTSIGSQAFDGCTDLTSVTMPDSLTSIEDNAFGLCSSLTSLTLPDSITSIGMDAFSGCNSLTNFILPDGVTSIGPGAFSYCSSLTSVTLPGSVTSIESCVLSYCGSLINVTLSDGVTSIGWGAFSCCNSLTSVTLPSSVTSIEDSAFSNCFNFKDVYYSGTMAQWGATSIISDDNLLGNDHLRSATIHCSDGDINDTDSDPTQWPINQKEVFLKQQGDNTCTLATVTMMVRRRAILDGVSDWRSMTEKALSTVAWCSSGLIETFHYRGMRGGTDSIRNKTLSQKKDYLISMLQQHPEGIGVYRYTKGVQRHAILLTDYDQATDTFYCADPQGQTGRVPLTQCSIRGDDANHTLNPQDAILNVLHRTYYIAKNAPQKNIANTVIRTNYPVELRLTVNGETLDSTGLDGISRNSHAVMTASGQGQNRNVEVQINRGASQDEIVAEAHGTSTGAATFTVTHTYTDDTSEQHTFKNIPVKDTTVINTAGLYPQSTVLLTVEDTSSPAQETDSWAANPNEEISRPVDDSDTDGSGIPDTPDDGQLHGEITVSAAYNAEGELVTLRATPDPGYQLASIAVTEDGGNRRVSMSGPSHSGNSDIYTFAMPAYDVTVQAKFTRIR